MGRSSPTLDDLRNEHGVNQRNGASRPETFSYQNANYLGREMEPNAFGHPTTVNVMASMKEGKIVKFINPVYKPYLEDIKAYGFDHVILIGECYNGMLFLDCYGRLFEWGNMMAVLWPLGDYWSVMSKGSSTRSVIWGLEYDGTITEFEDTTDDLPEPATKTTDVHPVAKKKKNSKKKNSKKKH
ncbi:unnamed protein product [Rhizophagus irregularis]|nr:unnamed protein product [Rhizophagus irregularis]